jgi:predicted Rossmann fold nucleotide-binding protein DprA/Smf involved in DNA uptake
MRILKPNLSALIIDRENRLYPELLVKRLGKDAPERLWVVGNPEILALPKTALFCSMRCPGDAVIKAMDQARKWRDEGRCIISGFHSPIEKECLHILLRGRQPIIICPARGIENMRIPGIWRPAVAEGRVLILSIFSASERRMTAKLSTQRNQMVAALADEICFMHISPGGRMSQLFEQVSKSGIPNTGGGINPKLNELCL